MGKNINKDEEISSNAKTNGPNSFEDATKVPVTSLESDLEIKMDDVDIDKVRIYTQLIFIIS